jgi:hypothetical protein
MPSVTIQLHAIPSDEDLTASDAPTIDALRLSFPSPSYLVHAHEVEPVLRKLHPEFAKTLARLEEPSMVTVEFKGA